MLKWNVKSRIMGEEWEHMDSFFSQLSRDVWNAKLEQFLFRDFIIMLTLNDLQMSKLNKAKLGAMLNLL